MRRATVCGGSHTDGQNAGSVLDWFAKNTASAERANTANLSSGKMQGSVAVRTSRSNRRGCDGRADRYTLTVATDRRTVNGNNALGEREAKVRRSLTARDMHKEAPHLHARNTGTRGANWRKKIPMLCKTSSRAELRVHEPSFEMTTHTTF
jgi:hypothetical protein